MQKNILKGSYEICHTSVYRKPYKTRWNLMYEESVTFKRQKYNQTYQSSHLYKRVTFSFHRKSHMNLTSIKRSPVLKDQFSPGTAVSSTNKTDHFFLVPKVTPQYRFDCMYKNTRHCCSLSWLGTCIKIQDMELSRHPIKFYYNEYEHTNTSSGQVIFVLLTHVTSRTDHAHFTGTASIIITL